MRSFFLKCSESRWLREHATRHRFVRRAVSRFMPGESVWDALAAALVLREHAVGSVFTRLGENVTDAAEAEAVTAHYLEVVDRIPKLGLDTEVSVKLTQLGLDQNPEFCYRNVERIVQRAGAKSVVWIDMEASHYVDAALELYRRARKLYPNVGICLQAYLYRTPNDLGSLLPVGAAIRLVKGAYMEAPSLAMPRKRDVDAAFFALAKEMLSSGARGAGVRAAFATHDRKLIRQITEYAESQGLSKSDLEFQMLYGIQTEEQYRLAREGFRSIVLVAYGSYWFPWYMRRLAERPANAWFVLRNLFAT